MKHLFLAGAFLCAATGWTQRPIEPLGPSSRLTPIAISEIMYKPANREDGRNTEFIELYNSNPWPEDISGFRLSGAVDFTFPPGTAIPGRGFVVVAAVPGDLETVYGLSGVFGPYEGSLKTSGTIHLNDEQKTRLLQIEYRGTLPWPMGADGTGHSIVLARASYGEGDARAWSRSEMAGGSPGVGETQQPSPLSNVVINEILAHTDLPEVDAIELYNHSNDPADLSGCVLSDDPRINRFILPTNTVIPARGFLVFTETDLGFALNAAGETIYFKSAEGARVLDALRFDAQENGVSFGRSPDGACEWSRLSAKTLGSGNAPPLVNQVGFNEIMYHPISENDDDQYVELFNQGTTPVDLSGWKFVDGISFTFPANTVIGAGDYLVVARNALRLMTNYPQLNPANTLGDFGGRLSGAGERLALAMPEVIVTTNNFGLRVTNYVDIVVDEVTYGTGGRWGRWSDGGGSSLELIDARADKRLAANWADSDETEKAPWTTIERTGVLDNGSGSLSPLQLGLLDAGECLVDDVEVLAGTGGQNYAVNPGFEGGMTGLSFVGNHSRTSLAPGAGYPSGGNALHVRTGDGIMTGPNAIEIGLMSNPLSSSSTATLRFKARWLRGCPEPLLRFWGCHLEATGRLSIPSNLGTPGLPNSQASTNAGPAIYQVTHTPAVPAAFQPVVVTARVSDPDGLESLILRYRFDPSTMLTNVVMNDAGTNGDAVAGDGIYSGTLPGRNRGPVFGGGSSSGIAFSLVASDTSGATNRFPELVQDNAPVRECVVIFGDPSPTNLFGTYHLWLSQTNVDRWKSLPVMSNEDIDGTLVYNNRVIYNMGGRYSGSPWHQSYTGPAGSPCHYIWTMPKDDLLLGASSFNKIHWPGNEIQNNDDPTLQREQAAYMFFRELGIPWSYRRFVAVYVNGGRRGQLMEDAYRPTGRSVKDHYLPDDSDVQLYKLQRWYNGSTTQLISECRLQRYTTTGGAWKTARYRPVWGLKESPGSLSDFSSVYALITAASPSANFEQVIESVVDMENWMRSSAANHAVGNWDAFGSSGSGQNVSAWLSAQQRWTLFTIDLSICLDNWLAWGGLFGMNDAGWQRMFDTPKFGRMYYRALNELANGVMRADVINPVMDAKYDAFRAAGLYPSAPTSTKSWIANRRNTIISALAPVSSTAFTLSQTSVVASANAATITGSAPVEVVSININGTTFEPRWTSLTNWSLTVPVPAGTNIWTLVAYDRYGNTVGDTNTVTVSNSGTPSPPAGNVVISEIMFNAVRPEAEFVELFNRSSNTPFDLSGWRLNGISYTFPPGSVLAANSYLVLARSRIVFATTYDPLTPVFDQFNGNLQKGGETLSLIQPGATPAEDLVVDRVRYEATAPWPAGAVTRAGTSLQLVSVSQDNSRVANWSAASAQSPPALQATPGKANSVAKSLPPFPSLWLNEAQPENLTGAIDGHGERDPWIELYNDGTNEISLAGYYLGTNYSAPLQWAFPEGASIAPGQFLVVWTDGEPEQSGGDELHANFRLTPGQGSIALSRIVDSQPQIVDYLNYSDLPANNSYGDVPDGQPFYREVMFYATPGGTNNAALPTVTVFINEWMAENDGYLFNPATGKYDDWFEIHNPTDGNAELGGYYLTDNPADPFQFRIPDGCRVPPGGFLLAWADSEPSANSTNDPALHVSFKLDKAGEAVCLFAPDGTAIDAVSFGSQSANVSEGRYPDAGGLRLFMPVPSPGAPNILPPASGPPVVVGVSAEPGNPVAVTFNTSPGHTYQVEFKNDVNDPAWIPLGTPRFASGAALTIEDHRSGARRFYRIVMLD